MLGERESGQPRVLAAPWIRVEPAYPLAGEPVGLTRCHGEPVCALQDSKLSIQQRSLSVVRIDLLRLEFDQPVQLIG